MHPTTKLFPFLFISLLDFSAFFRLFPDASNRHKIVPLPVPLISGFFFRIFLTFYDLFLTRLTPTKLFPLLFLLFPDVSGFFLTFLGRFPDVSDRHKIVPFLFFSFLDFSGFFGSFRLFLTFFRMRSTVTSVFSIAIPLIPDLSAFHRIFPAFFRRFSGCVRPPQYCSLSCSCHFRIFPDFSDFFRRFSGCVRLPQNCSLPVPFICGFFRLVPDASDPHKIVPLPVHLISRFFRFCPTFSGCVRPPQNCSLSCSSPFRIFSGFSGLFGSFRLFPTFFRMRSTVTFAFLCYSSHFWICPHFTEFFRLCPTFFRMRRTATILFPFLSSHFRIFTDLSDFFDVFPDAFDCHKIVPFLFLSFADFSDLFRMRPTPTKLFPFLFISFPDFSDFARRFPDASDRRKIVPFPVLLLSGFFPDFPDFSDLSDFFRPFSGCVRPPQNCSPSCASHVWIFRFADMFWMRPAATKLTGPLVV